MALEGSLPSSQKPATYPYSGFFRALRQAVVSACLKTWILERSFLTVPHPFAIIVFRELLIRLAAVMIVQ
jgi:hypothetical protein